MYLDQMPSDGQAHLGNDTLFLQGITARESFLSRVEFLVNWRFDAAQCHVLV
jgi:hypothetical protein